MISFIGPLQTTGIGHGSKFLGLGINGLMMLLLDMCQWPKVLQELLQLLLELLQLLLELLQFLLELLQLLLELRQFLLELLLVFLAKFLFLEHYIFSPYIILVSNRLVG